MNCLAQLVCILLLFLGFSGRVLGSDLEEFDQYVYTFSQEMVFALRKDLRNKKIKLKFGGVRNFNGESKTLEKYVEAKVLHNLIAISKEDSLYNQSPNKIRSRKRFQVSSSKRGNVNLYITLIVKSSYIELIANFSSNPYKLSILRELPLSGGVVDLICKDEYKRPFADRLFISEINCPEVEGNLIISEFYLNSCYNDTIWIEKAEIKFSAFKSDTSLLSRIFKYVNNSKLNLNISLESNGDVIYDSNNDFIEFESRNDELYMFPPNFSGLVRFIFHKNEEDEGDDFFKSEGVEISGASIFFSVKKIELEISGCPAN